MKKVRKTSPSIEEGQQIKLTAAMVNNDSNDADLHNSNAHTFQLACEILEPGYRR